MAAVRIRNLSVRYGAYTAIHGLEGDFEDGSLTAVVGPNGAGKTTLLNALKGFLAPTQGSIEFGRSDAHVAYLPQHAELDRTFPISVRELVSLGAWRYAGAFAGYSHETLDRISEALGQVSLQGLEERPIASLSTGQFQRALFARLLVTDARVILLDEPFNAIDTRTTRDLLEIVRRWHVESRTVVAVLHDLEQVRRVFPDCLLLARECISWGRTADVLVPRNLEIAQELAERWQDLSQ